MNAFEHAKHDDVVANKLIELGSKDTMQKKDRLSGRPLTLIMYVSVFVIDDFFNNTSEPRFSFYKLRLITSRAWAKSF